MKTLFLYTVQIYLFCSCTCIWGIPQPRPDDSSRKLSNYVENVIKKCQDVSVDATKSNYLDPDSVLCIGVKALSHQFHGGLQENLNFAGVEKKYKEGICEHFHEMKLNSTQDKLNERYNLQFVNKLTCEQACLDVMKNVNPVCSVILLLSHNSKGSSIVSGTQAPSTTPSDGKVGNDNNEVPDQSRKFENDVPSRNLDGQQTGSGMPKVNVEQKTNISTQVKTVNRQKSQDGDNSMRQGPEDIPQVQTPQRTKLTYTDDVGTDQQPDPSGVGSVDEKPKATNKEITHVPETVIQQLSTNELPEGKVSITPENNTEKKESKVTNAEDTSSVVDSNKEGKLDSSLHEKGMAQSSVVLPSNSGGIKNGQDTATKPKMQGNMDTVEDRLTPKKVVIDTGVKGDDSIPQAPNVAEDKGIVNDKKSQTDNKHTENPSQKEADLPVNNKITNVMPNSNTDEEKTNQNNEKTKPAQNAEPAAQSDKSETQTVTSDGGSFTSDTGSDVAEPDLHLSDDAGELNDNTGIYSGGGTGVDSDVFEPGTNTILNTGAVLFPERDVDEDDSHFFAYFMTTMVFCIVGYLLFHNKQKILALALEGRARRGRRRPNTSGYRKLDSNLEEAISSSKSASVTQVIY